MGPADKPSTPVKRLVSSLRRQLSGGSPGESTPEELRSRILSDPFLYAHYLGTYQKLLGLVPPGRGAVIEIGSGVGLIDLLDQKVLKMDLEYSPLQNLTGDACNLPFADNSLKCLILKDSFHHIPDIKAFLKESLRSLRPGGRIVVFDPYWGPLAQFVYRHLHPEPFDDSVEDWDFPASGPWSSNQALLHLVLNRDKQLFTLEFPNFTVEEFGACVGPSYLLSGGLYGRTLIPSRLLIRLREWEESRGPGLDKVRFGFIATFEKKPGNQGDLNEPVENSG